MMIKITKEQFLLLEQYELSRYEFGTKNGADTDYLCVVQPNIQMDCSFNNDHLLFYKDEENKVDYLVCTPRMILHSIINGNCDLFYHMLFQNMFSYGVMQFLSTYDIEQFHSKRMFKSLLGVAKRDLKQLRKLNEREYFKKLSWVVQYIEYLHGILYKQGINVTFSNDYKNTLEDIGFHIDNVRKLMSDELIYDLSHNEFLDQEYGVSDLCSLDFVKDLYYGEWSKTL
jgi:hypothetical protein